MTFRQSFSRREFVRSAGITIAGAAALQGLGNPWLPGHAHTKKYTVQDIINQLIAPVAGAPFPNTVDTLKSGRPDQVVTGIVTTMFATADVIMKAQQAGANFIIAHEPTFYNHTDDKQWAGENHIVRQKETLLNKTGMAVWRFHDYQHSYKPDQTRQGVLVELGWEAQFDPTTRIVTLSPTTLGEVVEHVKTKLGIAHVRVVGKAAQVCRRIALMPGAAGGQAQIRMIEEARPDLFICGEVHEWETAENVRDAQRMGENISLMLLGHAESEEPGMKLLANELSKSLDGLPVTHIPSGSPFSWM